MSRVDVQTARPKTRLGQGVPHPKKYIITLSAEEAGDLDAALRSVLGHDVRPAHVSIESALEDSVRGVTN